MKISYQIVEAIDTYLIKNTLTNSIYEVDKNFRTCSCPDYIYRKSKQGQECKHILLLKSFKLSGNWEIILQKLQK